MHISELSEYKQTKKKRRKKWTKEYHFDNISCYLALLKPLKLHSIIPFFPYNPKFIDSTNIYVPPLFFQGSYTSPEPPKNNIGFPYFSNNPGSDLSSLKQWKERKNRMEHEDTGL